MVRCSSEARTLLSKGSRRRFESCHRGVENSSTKLATATKLGVLAILAALLLVDCGDDDDTSMPPKPVVVQSP